MRTAQFDLFSKAPQLDLFDKPARQAPRKLMHVFDYGSGMAHFKCRCGYDDGWTPATTLSADKRGRPCPRCNPTEGATQ